MQREDNCQDFWQRVTYQNLNTIPTVSWFKAASNQNFHHKLCWVRYCFDLVFRSSQNPLKRKKNILTHGRIMVSRYYKCKRECWVKKSVQGKISEQIHWTPKLLQRCCVRAQLNRDCVFIYIFVQLHKFSSLFECYSLEVHILWL